MPLFKCNLFNFTFDLNLLFFFSLKYAFGPLRPAKDGEKNSCNRHQVFHQGYPRARAGAGVTDRDALVAHSRYLSARGAVAHLLDEEEEGLKN